MDPITTYEYDAERGVVIVTTTTVTVAEFPAEEFRKRKDLAEAEIERLRTVATEADVSRMTRRRT